MAAARHRGTAVIEVMVNCVIFNDGTFDIYTDKDKSADHVIKLRHGEPMLFGKENEKALIMDGALPKVVQLSDMNVSKEKIMKHDKAFASSSYAYMLASMEHPQFPMPVGILRQVTAPTYEDSMKEQENEITSRRKRPGLDEILCAGDTWVVR